MMYLKFKAHQLCFSIILTTFLLSCSDGVDSESPQEPPISTSTQDTKTLVDSDSSPTTPNNMDLKIPDWNSVTTYYNEHPNFNVNAQYNITNAFGNIIQLTPFILESSDLFSIKFNTISSSEDSNNNSTEKIIENMDYTLWVEAIKSILNNPDIFPKKEEQVTINNQTYDAITFSNVPAYIVLKAMGTFYFEKDWIDKSIWEIVENNSIYTGFNKEKLALNIFHDILTLRNDIYSSTLQERVSQRETTEKIINGQYELCVEPVPITRYETALSNLERTSFFADNSTDDSDTSSQSSDTEDTENIEEQNPSISFYLDTASEDDLKEIRQQYITMALKNEMLKLFQNDTNKALLTLDDYLVISSDKNKDTKTSTTSLYKIEKVMFNTSITILKDNFIPVDLSIESTNELTTYKPMLSLSIIK